MTSKEKKKLTRKDKFTAAPKKTTASTNTYTFTWIPGLIIALLGFILYSNTLDHKYTLDDYSVILENRLTKQGSSAIPEIFKTSYRYGYHFTTDNLYRPIVKAMYAAEWGKWPNNAGPGHFINVLLYAFTGFILYMSLFRISSGHTLFAFLASILFIAHPIHTEVVASIKSRDEILAFLFGIWALERFIHGVRYESWSATMMAGFLYFVALMSKESAITFLAVFPLAAWIFTNSTPSVWLRKMIPLAVTAALFLLIRSAVLSGSEPESVSVADNLLMAAKDPLTRILTAIAILGRYLKLLVFPHPLVFDYSFNQIPLATFTDVYFLAGFIAHVALLIYGFQRARAKDIMGFAILFYFITISVSSNIFMIIGSSMGERFLYTPSLGYCMGIALLISKWVPNVAETGAVKLLDAIKKPVVLLPLLVLLSGYSLKTITRNPVWKDNYTLYSNDVLLSPNSTRTHYYLGNYLVKPEVWEGKSDAYRDSVLYKGIASLRKSIEIYPSFADSWIQMGVAYYKMNKPDSAMVCYQEALKLNPGNATIHNNIGTVYFSKGMYKESLDAFLKATQLDPRYSEAHANAGSAYGMMQQYDNALNSLFQSVKWDPNYAQAYFFIGITYQFKGDKVNADAYLQKAYKLDPKLKKG